MLFSAYWSNSWGCVFESVLLSALISAHWRELAGGINLEKAQCMSEMKVLCFEISLDHRKLEGFPAFLAEALILKTLKIKGRKFCHFERFAYFRSPN